ncbi:MAG: hypothetical protein ACI9YO_002308 [Gammaproteobacteria bacterium]|jgi:hypothetical protein
MVVRNIEASNEKSQIDSISPKSAYKIHPLGKTVPIKGKNFKADVNANFLVFFDAAKLLPYKMTSATKTEILVIFFVDRVIKEGR